MLSYLTVVALGPVQAYEAGGPNPTAKQQKPTLEEWLADSNTWRKLADKLYVLGLYPLAADMYQEALARGNSDPWHPKLLSALAKASLCGGRVMEAQHAARVSSRNGHSPHSTITVQLSIINELHNPYATIVTARAFHQSLEHCPRQGALCARRPQ